MSIEDVMTEINKLNLRKATQSTDILDIFRTGEISWNRGTLINVSCKTYKRRVRQGKIMVFFLQDTVQV